jgi:DNA-directed RNA polymerase specialized sigma24 family protein
MTKKNAKHVESATAYATAADFKQILTQDVNSLYLLSLLLTGDPEKAENCFVEGIGESTKGNHVFKEWARSWARRNIIQSAIRLIAPRERPVTAIRTGNTERVMDTVPMVLHAEVCAILELAPLERFVFVMSVLERYSDNDSSILLGCARRDIATLRARAIQQLATSLHLKSPADSGLENSAASEDTAMLTELLIVHHFATPAWSGSL